MAQILLKTVPTLIILLTATIPARAQLRDIREYSRQELEERISKDSQSVQVFRDGLSQVLGFASSRPDLFSKGQPGQSGLLTRDQKEEIRGAWKSLLDYYLSLDSLAEFYGGFY